jgi:hypothetical protein
MAWRILTGLIPGFVLAASFSGWLCWLAPGIWTANLTVALLWFFPFWVAIFTMCLIARNPYLLCLKVSLTATLSLGALRIAQWSGFIL